MNQVSRELFLAHNQKRYEKKVERREYAIKILTSKKIPFVLVKDDLSHVRVMDKIEFFPGTGFYHIPFTAIRGRGVHNLIYLATNMKVDET